MPKPMTPGQRDAVAARAAARYRAGESWAVIAADEGLSAEHLRRITTARHDIAFHPWGARPAAEPARVAQLRAGGATIPAIARDLGVSQTAVRTALQAEHGAPAKTRYPLLDQRRGPTRTELAELEQLYAACPPTGRPGHRVTGGEEGRKFAEASRRVVTDGVPMDTLSRALGRGPTFVHSLLGRHDMRIQPRQARPTAIRGGVDA